MKAFLAAILLGVTVHAQSATITIDFEGVSPNQWFNTNIAYQGLRFSPSCTHRIVTERAYAGGTTDYLSTDQTNNCDELVNNTNYLGEAQGAFGDLFIDREGQPFSLLGLRGISADGSQEFVATSSKGGKLVSTYDPSYIPNLSPYRAAKVDYTLAGDLWTDIAWFTLDDRSNGGSFHNRHGWDNIRYEVRGIPEPGTMLLIGLGLAFLAIARRKRRSQYGNQLSVNGGRNGDNMGLAEVRARSYLLLFTRLARCRTS